MSDPTTWRVITDERNPHDIPGGHALIHGWSGGADADTDPPTVVISVELGGLPLADLIVASLQATSQDVRQPDAGG